MDKTIARNGDMYRDDSGILSLVFICTQTLRYKISLFEFPLLKLFAETKSFFEQI